jgi:anti-sigma regulatory factor (Ser/Thr protein kinase)
MSVTDDSSPPGRPGAVHGVWPVDPRVLSEIRRTIRAWLDRLDVASDLRDDLVYATSEAATNAIEHAYRSPDASSTVEVTLWAEPGVVNIEIADRGCWLPATPHPTNRGHGLQLIGGLVGSVAIQSGADGTTVLLRHPVPQAHILQAEPAAGR